MAKIPKKYLYTGPVDPALRARSRKGGQAKSEKKTQAVRDNGLLGGRPKKVNRNVR
jgi:hypothetical protein